MGAGAKHCTIEGTKMLKFYNLLWLLYFYDLQLYINFVLSLQHMCKSLASCTKIILYDFSDGGNAKFLTFNLMLTLFEIV